jgi:hypothetical protein
MRKHRNRRSTFWRVRQIAPTICGDWPRQFLCFLSAGFCEEQESFGGAGETVRSGFGGGNEEAVFHCTRMHVEPQIR